ncbi:ABC transporter permease [Clostridium estertheticum]|uniref:ABC transporter permease n=1 Tax=Clostridium estertheticum TaxID=238834 RepID=UPI0013E90B10|nr:ABC transporter permease [Clostridium estertheticum]MBZ9685522.1 ABC transporter permease [Clostridium estertheticum]
MNILYIAFNTIKRNFRDKKSMFRSMLMPILMIIVLGTALNSAFQSPKLDKIDICYLNKDGGAAAGEFENFLSSKQIKEILNVKEVLSIEEGEKLINDKQATSMIVVPKDYSVKLKSGEETPIQIYNSKYADFKNIMVENIVEAYNSVGNVMTVVAKLNSENLGYTSYSAVDENVISTEGTSPRAIDYYSIAMLVLAIMSSATFAADMLSEDYFENVGIRIKASPAKPYERLIGMILGCVLDIFIKGVIIIAFSKFVFKVNWGNNLGMVAVIILSAAVFSTLFGMFVAVAAGSGNKASGILLILNIIFTFLAGGFALILTQDIHMSAIMHLSPNFYPQTALLNVIYSNNYRVNIHFFNTFGYISMLWIVSALLFIGCIEIERRRII